MVGDLPEIVEDEIDGDPVAVPVTLPVTINGRIFPRQDIDLWSFSARKGQSITCVVNAARIGSPLDASLAVLDAGGRVLAENDDSAGKDPVLRFVAPAAGTYRVRIRDANNQGGQAYVYRLTLTSDPYVDRVYPLGGQRGQKRDPAPFWPGRAGKADRGHPARNGLAQLSLSPHNRRQAGQRGAARCGRLAGGVPCFSPLSPGGEGSGVRGKSVPKKAQPVTVPAMLNGCIAQPGHVDRWEFTAHKGDKLSLELRAAQLGSPLAGVLTISDAQGKQLGRAEGSAAQVDPVLGFVAPADGTYTVQIADRFRTRGGPAFAYRLRLAHPPRQDFRLRLAADTVTVPRGGQGRLRIQAERQNLLPGPITLAFDGLPPGIKVTGTTIPAGQQSVDVTFTAETAAAIGPARLTVRGTAMVGDKAQAQPVTRTATLAAPRGQAEVDSLLLAVALPAPFKVVADFDMRIAPRGSVLRRRYRIQRNGYTGPFEVCVADRQMRHLQGAHGPTITVPAGVSEFEYPVTLPPWMEIGRTCRVCVMTMATIKDGTTEHQVSYSTVGQNDQVVTVVETGLLALEAEKSSVTVRPGQSVSVPVRMSRGKGLTGAVKIELILGGHMRGVRTDPLVIHTEQNNGRLTFHFDRAKLGPFNQPGVIRATLIDKGAPVVAETPLDLVTEGP